MPLELENIRLDHLSRLHPTPTNQTPIASPTNQSPPTNQTLIAILIDKSNPHRSTCNPRKHTKPFNPKPAKPPARGSPVSKTKTVKPRADQNIEG
jgi:hypothetical protein